MDEKLLRILKNCPGLSRVTHAGNMASESASTKPSAVLLITRPADSTRLPQTFQNRFFPSPEAGQNTCLIFFSFYTANNRKEVVSDLPCSRRHVRNNLDIKVWAEFERLQVNLSGKSGVRDPPCNNEHGNLESDNS